MRARTTILLATSVAALTFQMGSAQATEPTATGLWQKLDDAGRPEGWFLIGERNGIYEGYIARMFLKPGQDPNALCTKCTDDRKDKPWLGISLIRGMKRQGLDYEDGNILDPRDGKIYKALMQLSPDGQTLSVRGYLGWAVFGQSQAWKRLPDAAMKDLDPAIAKLAQAPAPAPQRPTGSVPKRTEGPRPKSADSVR